MSDFVFPEDSAMRNPLPFLDAVARSWTRIVVPITIPHPEKTGRYDVVGTAFVALWRDREFLVTCEHVVRVLGRAPDGIAVVRIADRAFLIRDTLFRLDHEHDLAVCPVRNILRANRCQEDLKVQAIDLDDAPGHSETESHFIVGFPNTKNRRSPRRGETDFCAYSHTVFRSGSASAPRTEMKEYIRFEFRRREMLDSNGRACTAPDPHGVSGGPILQLVGRRIENSVLDVFRNLNEKRYTCRLVAIAAEWHEARGEVLGTPKLALTNLLNALPH